MNFPRFTASILLFTGLFASVALGREALSGSADALKISLKDLHTTLASRDLGFHLSSPKVFRLVDHTADSAEALARSAGAGESKSAVGTAMNDLRGHLEEMRGVISHMNLAENERKALRNVDVRYGDVVLCWQAYGSAGEELFLHHRSAAASAEGSVSPVASLSRPLPAPASTPAAASKPAPEPKPAKASAGMGASGRARSQALSYLSNTYGIPSRDVRIDSVVDLPNRYRVTAYVHGHLRAIDLDPASGKIYLDMLVN